MYNETHTQDHALIYMLIFMNFVSENIFNENFVSLQNIEFYENFILQKFGAIQYRYRIYSTSETRAKCASNIITRKLNKHSSAVNM